MRKKKRATDLDGAKVLYPYLQKDLQTDNIWLFQMLASRLLTALGIWMSTDVYRRIPIILPHVIRDESARSRKSGKEAWGSPDSHGCLRDDNSLIKEAVKTLETVKDILNVATAAVKLAAAIQSANTTAVINQIETILDVVGGDD